jgi:hypothetical protein
MPLEAGLESGALSMISPMLLGRHYDNLLRWIVPHFPLGIEGRTTRSVGFLIPASLPKHLPLITSNTVAEMITPSPRLWWWLPSKTVETAKMLGHVQAL